MPVSNQIKTGSIVNASEVETKDSASLERRSFLGALIGLIMSSITTALGLIIGRYTLAPALSATNPSEWTSVALLEEIPEGVAVKRRVVTSQDAGWGRFDAERLVWVLKKGESVTVFSAVCPHLGCTIKEAANGFMCPCHGSEWSAAGEKLGGPAPRAMDTINHRLEDGLLKIRYQRFKQGTAKKEAVS